MALNVRDFAFTAFIGLAGGYTASLIGAPLPWMLGSMLFVGLVVGFRIRPLGCEPAFPLKIRPFFIAVIGVSIGGALTPEVAASMTGWLPSLIAVVFFVLLAHGISFVFLSRIAGFDRKLAFFCGAPGGLVEVVLMGEEAGADQRVLSIFHLVRIVFAIVAIPVIFLVMRGEVVGSAAGISGPKLAFPGIADALILLSCGVIGYMGGKWLRIPAAQLTGPLIASGIAHVLGWTASGPPGPLIALSQVAIGISTAVRFHGIDRQILSGTIAMSIANAALIMAVGAGLAFALSPFLGVRTEVLFLCFSAGGLVEMSLIALSLNANPVFVTAHHVVRIVAAVFEARWLSKRVTDT